MKVALCVALSLGLAGMAPAQTTFDDGAALALTEKVIDDLHAGQAWAVHAQFAPAVRAAVTAEAFAAEWQGRTTDHGQPDRRAALRVTWYDDPNGTGRIAAVDFALRYPDDHMACGYHVWVGPQGDGAAVLNRMEVQFLPAALVIGPAETFVRQFQKTLCKTVPTDMLGPRT